MGNTEIKKHAMIDLETLGRPPDGMIISFGACIFTMDGEITNEIKINIHPEFECGGTVNLETIMWWLQQNKEAQERLFDPEPQYYDSAFDEITAWFDDNKPDRVWVSGASFDLEILRNFYKSLSIDPPPWNFRQEMCMRSIRELGETIGLDYDDWCDKNANQVHHDALCDAIAQAKYVIEIFNKVGRRGHNGT